MFNFPLGDENELDPLLEEAAKIVIQYDRASASLIQRRLSIGYARSARILDQLEQSGVVGPSEGAMAREVLITSLPALKKIKSITKEVEWPQISYSHLKPDFISLNKKPAWLPQLPEILRSKKTPAGNFLIGQAETGKLVTESFSSLPNLLIIGNPDSRKEVFADALLLQILLQNDPAKFRLVIIDETGYFNLYNNLPHLLTPVIFDPYKAASALMWLISEMQRRQKIFTEFKARNISTYNAGKHQSLPYILTLISVKQIDSQSKDFIEQLTVSGLRAGMITVTLIDRATYRQIPTDLKANLPNRLVFKTTTALDSTVAGVKGAADLAIGQAIYKTNQYQQGIKLTTLFVSDKNINQVFDKIKRPA